MTVGELRKALKDYPDDMILACCSLDWERDYVPFDVDCLGCQRAQPCAKATGWIWYKNVRTEDLDPQKLVNLLIIGVLR